MERVMALRQGLTPAVLAANPQVEFHLWNRYVAASRAQNPEELKIDVQLAAQGTQGPIQGPLAAPGALAGAPGGGAMPPNANGGVGGPPLRALIQSMLPNGSREGR